MQKQKVLILLTITSLFLTSCLKDKPGITSEIITTKLGNPLIDTLRYQNRVDVPEPALNWVSLTNVSVNSYVLDFSWIWGKSNMAHGGGSVAVSHINIAPTIHGSGFALIGAYYTNFTNSALVTITISGHPTHLFINTITKQVEVIKDEEVVLIIVQFNVNTGVNSVGTSIYTSK